MVSVTESVVEPTIAQRPEPIHFDVQLSEPYESVITWGDRKGETTTGLRNVQLDVITSSAARAIELVLARHPQGIVHVVQRRGKSRLVLDPLVVVAASGES